MRKKFRENPATETCFLKFSQPAAGKKTFWGNTVVFLTGKKTFAETTFDWNLIFPRKTKTKKIIR
jgi:hypothetical protein